MNIRNKKHAEKVLTRILRHGIRQYLSKEPEIDFGTPVRYTLTEDEQAALAAQYSGSINISIDDFGLKIYVSKQENKDESICTK